MLPTPPEAPVTAIGPPVGDWPFCSRRWMASAAVNPASAERHGGEGVQALRYRNDPVSRHPRELRVAAVVGLGQPAAGHEHRIPGPVACIARALDDARQIDAADQRVAAQDLAGPGRRERGPCS